MKRILYSISIVLLLFSFFGGCEKLSSEEKQEIERFKNSPRDSRIIGQWKYITIRTKEEYVIDYRRDGRMIIANPVYNEKNEIIHYKNDRQELYFYTECDSILNSYIVLRDPLHTSYSAQEVYKIENDTLYRYTIIGSLNNKGGKVCVTVKD